jgi:hypothetical protein
MKTVSSQILVRSFVSVIPFVDTSFRFQFLLVEKWDRKGRRDTLSRFLVKEHLLLLA